MSVSIIIINYNTFDYTKRCIESVYLHTNDIDYEVILVDNGSNECDVEEFRKYFPQIKIVKNKENRGFSRACNDGIAVAEKEYILLLNSDTLLLNNAIKVVYEFLRNNKEVGAATCRVENTDGTPQSVCRCFPTIKLTLIELFRVFKLIDKDRRGTMFFGNWFSYDKIAYPDWITGTFFMFNREILKIFPNSKLTETFWMYYEDMEWCWHIKKNNYKVAFIPAGKILHYGKLSGNRKVHKLIKKNFYRFIFLYYNKVYATILIILLELLEVSQILGKIKHFKIKSFLVN